MPRPVAVFVGFALRAVARMHAIGLARTAASLSFTTLLALVPLATVALTFVARFPVFQRWLDALESFLLKHMLPDSAYAVVHHYILQFTEKAAGLTGISIVFIAMTAAMATATIEREINLIWGITTRRRLSRRASSSTRWDSRPGRSWSARACRSRRGSSRNRSRRCRCTGSWRT